MSDKLSSDVSNYLKNYTKVLKNLPPDIQKQNSRYFEIDGHHSQILRELSYFSNKNENITSTDGERMKKMLMDALDLADKKVEITKQIKNIVGESILTLEMSMNDIKLTNLMLKKKTNSKSKRLLKCVPNYQESDSDSLDDLSIINNSIVNKTKIIKTSNKNIQIEDNLKSNLQPSNIMVKGSNQNLKKSSKKKNIKTRRSKRKKKNSESSHDDSDVQPTYCICEEISYGDMVCCDNDLCPIEWFHFGCVSLTKKPKGKWYCPKCRGTSSKTMKPRQIFFKELEEYNKRKEEDW